MRPFLLLHWLAGSHLCEINRGRFVIKVSQTLCPVAPLVNFYCLVISAFSISLSILNISTGGTERCFKSFISSDRSSYSDDVLLYIQPLFHIFTQSVDAIDVTSVTLSRLNGINAIDVTRCALMLIEC